MFGDYGKWCLLMAAKKHKYSINNDMRLFPFIVLCFQTVFSVTTVGTNVIMIFEGFLEQNKRVVVSSPSPSGVHHGTLVWKKDNFAKEEMRSLS